MLQPLGGFLLLAERLHISLEAPVAAAGLADAFNYGPHRSAKRPVCLLVEEILRHCPGRWEDHSSQHPRGGPRRLPRADLRLPGQRRIRGGTSLIGSPPTSALALVERRRSLGHRPGLPQGADPRLHLRLRPRLPRVPGLRGGSDPIPSAGRVFSPDEVSATVGSRLDFWLTLGR